MTLVQWRISQWQFSSLPVLGQLPGNLGVGVVVLVWVYGCGCAGVGVGVLV